MGRGLASNGRIAGAVLLFCLWGLACGGETGDGGADDVVGTSLAVELGELSEQREFTPYADGEEEAIIMGLQAGYHIFVDGRLVGGNAKGEFLVRLIVTYDDGSELTRIEHLRQPELTDDEGNPTLPEMIIFIPDPVAAADRDVSVDVEVESDEVMVQGDRVALHLVDAAGMQTER
ncbi:MAG: hypothetical protein JKY37_32910 [Nannocystaceae bacterium]|nr:hypothetical protein [Nannocystaceae bacterium]